jgi:tyrosyl-tRNA synthetase
MSTTSLGRKDFIAELRWRGMVHDMTPGTEGQLTKEMTAAYIGFDPTAPSLHIGNLATIMLLKHFQLAGHKPIALVGGATGMIGDPSGKSAERNLLDTETLRQNQEGIKQQLSHFLDFDCGGNSAEMVNNYDWFKEIGFLDFLRDAGKHITINYMIAKDSVKNRMETGLSFTEFSYQLLQGYDFYYLYKNKGVKLQMGGSDQWGNITTGTEFIRRKAEGEAFALTAPLVTKSDGTKFGKSEGGNIWLSPELTSPYEFYQFWLNAADEDCGRLIRVFTLKSREEIEALEQEHAQAPHLRILQKAMAEEITTRVHSREAYEEAVSLSQLLFGKLNKEELEKLNENTLIAAHKIIGIEVNKAAFEEASNITELLSDRTQGQIFSSRGEARRLIQGGGVSINMNKINNPNEPVNYNLLHGKYLMVNKGKKNHFLIRVV